MTTRGPGGRSEPRGPWRSRGGRPVEASFGAERIGQGRENARLFLKEHRDIRTQLEAKLLPLPGLRAPGAAAEAAPAAASAAPAKPTPGAASARPQPAMVASGERKR